MGYDIPDIDISNNLIDLCTKNIIVTDEFRRFVKSGYIARDEQRFTKQIKTSIKSLTISTFALLLSVGFNVYNTYQNLKEKPNITTLEKKQIDTLVHHLQLLQQSLDSLKEASTKKEHIQSQVYKEQKNQDQVNPNRFIKK
ncbi:hypothetical protein GCM10027275_14680 [Rhabdobacter roseus]|uniref:Uncharacterized protein n=1 Tax=Rhabdobacter roseus TaxID=1655419 RepID=A0A840TTM7_9BACT|nr:hypothetical protein [Rhabdobacter roseus]MBB5283388.1 hypothetical protein [Rhabdobacter roseus]